MNGEIQQGLANIARENEFLPEWASPGHRGCMVGNNYSVCPASDEYAIGSPLFPKAEITLENGRKIVIDAKGNSPENRYIASMKINGRDWTHNYLKYGDLTSGARIVFNMSPDPDTSRGTSDEDKPYSFSTE